MVGERHARVFSTAHGTKPLESTRLKKVWTLPNFWSTLRLVARVAKTVLCICVVCMQPTH